MLTAFFLAATAPAEQPSVSHRVCSYNLRNWLTTERAPVPGIKPAGKPEREKVKVVQYLTAIAPAILGVCEIGTMEDLQDLRQRLAAAGLQYPHVVYAHGGDPTRRLGLLSQFPVVAAHSQPDLTYQIGELTLPFQRGILDATVQIKPDFQLRLLGLHLKSKRETAEADQELMRRNEAHLLREYLDQLLTEHPEEKVMLYGDFNEEPREAPIDEIRGNRATPTLLLHDVALRDANDEVWTHFWDLHDLYSRLDYFFVSPALRPFVNDRDAFIYTAKDFYQGSDHRPIVLTIDLSPRKKRR
ncbi:MAG: Endonuclease/Exonuclease/phosphatase family protein [Verrucomicrobiaceae bacterium]|nr:Endonuclease/Exonuclease/phosphatase family protein [Verrucomicrobiaceae bacterium]